MPASPNHKKDRERPARRLSSDETMASVAAILRGALIRTITGESDLSLTDPARISNSDWTDWAKDTGDNSVSTEVVGDGICREESGLE